MQDSLMQQNPMLQSPTQVPRTLRIPINSAYTFGTKNKLPAVLFVVPSLVVLDRWRPPFGIAIVLGVALLTVLSLVLRSYWLLEVVEDATPSDEAGEMSALKGEGTAASRRGLASSAEKALLSASGSGTPSDAPTRVARARLVRQFCLGKRVLRSREVDLSPYVWLRTTSLSIQEVTLELGNWSYQTLTLATVRSRGNSGLTPRKRQAAIDELCAIGAQVSAMTGITDRGFRDMA